MLRGRVKDVSNQINVKILIMSKVSKLIKKGVISEYEFDIFVRVLIILYRNGILKDKLKKLFLNKKNITNK